MTSPALAELSGSNSSPVVEHSTHNPKVEGSNHTTCDCDKRLYFESCVTLLECAVSNLDRSNDVQHNHIQHNDIQHNDTYHKGLICDTQQSRY
jgi:hypothetical protein